ncbi:MAG: M1 family metallopeptidase [Elusimicrobia bacterium]|nr:M1 family metallopeptidase [Elusimicrobiota bacterium]
MIAAVLVAVAAPPAGAQGSAGASRDVHSYAQPELVRVEHADLDLSVGFEDKTLRGSVVLRIRRLSTDAPLVLDSRDLLVSAVSASADGKTFSPVPFVTGNADAILGTPLTIELPPRASHVRLDYATSPNASALQWLEPVQTAGKTYPFLFTQSQAIHARSWIPLQDSPGVRMTYTARIRAPWPLSAIMSADGNGQEAVARPKDAGALDPKRWREFAFRFDKPIPSYLIALAVGDLSFKTLGPRTGVYAEPSVLARAASELEDVEGMMSAVEKLYGPYRWGRYDVLILPPSFAYGGMENPLLTFASPTILAGDKSLVGVLAHELAHSWSGNLVTNATARDFWLNEGFTTYVEGRILEAVYGPARAGMEAVLGRQSLEKELATLADRDKILHIDLAGRDPDEAVTSVPYEKGALFLQHLEETFGRERFDRFLREYFDAFAFQSITTERFREHLADKLLAADPALAARVPVDAWIEGVPIPDGAPRARADSFAAVEGHAAGWLEGKASDAALAAAAKPWGYYEWHHFLRFLPKDIAIERLARLDQAFQLTRSGNAELACEWLQIAIRRGYGPAYPRLEEFLLSVGRGKFVKPLYKELVKSPEGKAKAEAIFRKARPGYQVPVVAAVEKILSS